ncbi:RnfABCDGE type electron transport complex subunit D [Collinsella intestinalis]|uniref:Ion-translocating oxidoreductase complex subunit D n=1 Tax=Collinsella intestinalis TaxID=147207 RepID=A0A414NFC4_9ACTN|nr:RnfABCDGE type electron transport complex subunit D [Collinsella intestinalis]RHF38408.1 RnfABCDGE type electron transport complex subunit D [Collinsella intestinalis]
MNLINEASPHFHGKGSTQWIMGMVCLSLLPTLVASVFLYGLGAPLLVLVCVATALVTEHVCCRLMNRESTAGDLSCVVTAMLFAFTLPADCGYFPAILGTVFAIAVVKMLFGGIGCNFANPAVAARVFVMLAMPIALGAYPDIMGRPLDAITGATPLAMNAAGDAPYSYMDMMFGLHAGALGETCIITLLAGYVFLLVMRVVDAWATVPFIATVAAITGFAGQDAIYQVLSGGLALGAFYMATDYTTTPMTPKGKIIFGIGCGVITALVRLFAAAPEGVAFSILFMNMFTPLIDRYTRPQPAGGVKHALV